MNIEKLREVIRKYEENYDYFNDQAHDEIFKWNAVQHFQNVWLAPKANERSFPELFADARKKCSVLIDNAYVCPSSGVVKIAKKRPDEVEYLFRKVLLAPDGGDIDIRQDNVERFLDEMDRLCRETFPASFKYKQDRHAALCYLTLLKPDDNYIYRYSEAEEFAKHMEFGLDIGSGKSFCLKNYYILCNAVADELRGQRSLLDKVERRIQEYQNWFLRELTACWTNAAADDLATLGYISEIEKQRDFYKRYVAPASSKNTRAFVIISDALRYEVASELSERIVRNTKGTAELESMQAVFPSITKFGMAALLPGKSISVNDSMDVLVDGNPTRSTVERNAILNATPKASVAIQYNDLLNMKKDERRELVAGKDVIYIYHNSIDAIGDKAPTESKVFDACETAIQELSGILRIIVNELSGTNIFITADHGFLYTYKPLNESDKIDRKAFSGNVYELGRRYALAAPDTTADFLLPVNLERELDGTPVKGYAPQDTIRMKVQGGGENYVHGGIGLQELVVPVISFKNLRSTSKKYVEVSNAELKLLSESRKISNLIFSLEFHQRQPVGDKIQPCTYSIYMTDDEGVVISDRQTVIADKTSDNAADRVFRVRFNLKAGTYDKKKR